MVASFTNGKLTITLADGTSVSGQVTEATRIRCERPQTPTPGQMEEGGNGSGGGPGPSGGNDSSGGPGPSGGPGSSGGPGPDGGQSGGGPGPSGRGQGGESWGRDGQDGEGRGDDDRNDFDDGDDEAEPCTAAALVPGVSVREAELSIGGNGSVWEEVELVR